MKKAIWLCILVVIISFCGCMNNISQNDVLQNSKPISENLEDGKEHPAHIKQLVTTFTANIALLSDGRVFSWGENQSGVLGLGDDVQGGVYEPTQIEFEEPIKQITTSSQANTVIAISDSGKFYGWGSNKYHLLSDEDILYFSSPVLMDFNIPASQISVSPLLGTVSGNDGTIYGYGWELKGPSVHVESAEAFSASNHSLSELDLNGEKIVQIESSTLYRCFLNHEGEVLIQGSFVDGKITYDEVSCISFPERIIKIGSMYQGLVALSDSGKLYFLGEDRFGICGDDSNEYYPIYEQPVLIDKLNEEIDNIFVSSSSIIAVTENGSVFTWGYNLGKNDSDAADEIVTIPNRLEYNGTIKDCYCGEFSNIIIDENNDVYVWGSNVQNIFLDKNKESTYTPQKIDTSAFF